MHLGKVPSKQPPQPGEPQAPLSRGAITGCLTARAQETVFEHYSCTRIGCPAPSKQQADQACQGMTLGTRVCARETRLHAGDVEHGQRVEELLGLGVDQAVVARAPRAAVQEQAVHEHALAGRILHM